MVKRQRKPLLGTSVFTPIQASLGGKKTQNWMPGYGFSGIQRVLEVGFPPFLFFVFLPRRLWRACETEQTEGDFERLWNRCVFLVSGHRRRHVEVQSKNGTICREYDWESLKFEVQVPLADEERERPSESESEWEWALSTIRLRIYDDEVSWHPIGWWGFSKEAKLDWSGDGNVTTEIFFGCTSFLWVLGFVSLSKRQPIFHVRAKWDQVYSLLAKRLCYYSSFEPILVQVARELIVQVKYISVCFLKD